MTPKLSYSPPRIRSDKVFLAPLLGTTVGGDGYGGFRRPPPGK